jgi:integrase/recombinase XerD
MGRRWQDWRGMITHKSTKKRRSSPVVITHDYESLARFAESMKLRSLAETTQREYLRYVRKLAQRLGKDPAVLDESQVRAHLLTLKMEHHYSASTMRTAVAAMRSFYGMHLGYDWKLFDLVRCPDTVKLPTVLTRAEVGRLFSVIREPRFRTVFRLIYACGLRVSEAANLEVTDIKKDPCRLHLRTTKGNKERLVPVPEEMVDELRAFWRTHRHPRFVFPGTGRGWREGPGARERLGRAPEPMGVGSIQHCLRLALPVAGLPEGTSPHTLRHSYATHLLEEGVSIRLISAYLGHSSLETTVKYTHLTQVNEAHARAAVSRLLKTG